MKEEEYINLADDEEMQAKHIHTQSLCHKYSLLDPEELEKRRNLMKKIVNSIGENFTIEQPFHCDYGYFINIGKNFYANYNLTILDTASVTIGDNVFIGPNCGFYTSGHPLDYQTRNKGLEYAKPIKVGSNVWIGGNVCVMPGVTIGDNVVIGAGSVVNKDIPSNCVAVGNPCKVIKEI